ncbi:MAG TPA: hypothetical protein ENI66_00495 [Candidatus Yonathbacteria bacterium]|nr:hypothetical protein [Candidatus Yonathbacteria bacterium]
MPLCGFNEKMLDGLRQFGEGLFDQAEYRAKADSVDMLTSFDNEVFEINTFLQILSKKDPEKFQCLVGIAHITQALYKSGQGLESPKGAFLKNLDEMLKFFVEIDKKYYDDLRLKDAPQKALEKLGEWLEE